MLTVLSVFDAEGALISEEVYSRDLLRALGLKLGAIVCIEGRLYKLNFIGRNAVHKKLGVVNLISMDELVN